MGKPLCASDACFAHSILAVKLLFFSLLTRIQSACLRVIKYRVCVCISISQVFGWVPRVFKQRLIICCCAPLFWIKHNGKVTSDRCHTNTSIASRGQLISTDVMLPSAKFLCEVERRTLPNVLRLIENYISVFYVLDWGFSFYWGIAQLLQHSKSLVPIMIVQRASPSANQFTAALQ